MQNFYPKCHPFLCSLPDLAQGCWMLLLILAGFGFGNVFRLGKAAILSYDCSYHGGGPITVVPLKTFQIKIGLVGNCQPGCASCAPYVDDVGQFIVSVTPIPGQISCYWQRAPAGSNLYTSSCKLNLNRGVSPSTTQRYDVTVTVPSTNRSLLAKPYFYFLSGDLDPSNCGPLIWTPYPARSLYAGKQARFKLPLKDSSGFVKSTTTGRVSSADAKAFLSALTLSFINQISHLTSQYEESEGSAWVMFLPITCGTWTASAGVKAWPGLDSSGATFYGSPFDLTIKAGDISVNDSKGSWLNNVNVFKAGEAGTLRLVLMDAYMNNITQATGRIDFARFNVFSTNLQGNIAACYVNLSQEQKIGFEDVVVINNATGSYNLHVGATDSQRVKGSPFSYKIVSGDIWIDECTAMWSSKLHEAGRNSTLIVNLKDKYGNDVAGNKVMKFNVYTYTTAGKMEYEETSLALDPRLSQREIITFISTTAGFLSYYVSFGNKQIKGSPFNLTRLVGPLSPQVSKGFWNNGTKYFIKGKTAILEVILMDIYGNMVNASTAMVSFSMYFLYPNGTRFSQPYSQKSDALSGHAFITITVTSDPGSWPCHVFYNLKEIGGSPFQYSTLSGNSNATYVFVNWEDNVSTYEVGSYLYEELEFRDAFMNPLNVSKLKFTLSFGVDDPLAASMCFDIPYQLLPRLGYVSFSQLCLLAGTFHGYILMNSTKIANDLPPFRIIPGPPYIPFCQGSFLKAKTSFKAGEDIFFDVLLNDAYNNTVSKANGRVDEFHFSFEFMEMESNTSVNPKSLTRVSRRGSGHEGVRFIFTLPGAYLLSVGGTQPAVDIFSAGEDHELLVQIFYAHPAQIQNAPFSFEVTPSNPYIPYYVATWLNNVNVFPPLSEAIFQLTPRDAFNNTINATSSTQDPFLDLYISTFSKNHESGSSSSPVAFSIDTSEQSVTFNVSSKAGDYVLQVGDGTNLHSPLSYTVSNGSLSIAHSVGMWVNGSNTFMAGAEALLSVRLQDAYNNTLDDFVNFSLSFQNANDSGSSVGATTSLVKGNLYESIGFNITSAGAYTLVVEYNDTSILGSPFSFTMSPGLLSAGGSTGGPWLNNKTTFKVGERGALIVRLTDIYGNKISASDGLPKNFNSSVNCNDGQFNAPVNIKLLPLDNSTYAKAVFPVDFSGECMLTITNGTSNITGSPFDFKSYSGNLSIPYCVGSWINDTSIFRAGDQASLLVTFRDKRRNLVQPVYPYTQFILTIKLLNGSVYNTDISFLPGSNPSRGIITFNITLSGNFSLYVGDARFQIQSSPFWFEVLPGPIFAEYTDGVWLDGANSFESGRNVTVIVERFDAYRNKITSKMGSILYFYATWFNGSLLNEDSGYEGFTRTDTLRFTSTLTGTFLLHISDCEQNEIYGSPFEFMVTAGGAKNYKSQWAGNVSTFKAGTAGLLEIFLTDQYNNPIKELDDRDGSPIFESYIKSNKETKGIVDLKVVYDTDTSQVSVSFLAISTGKYSLLVMKNNQSIPESPFAFEVVPAEISTRNCKGSWLDGRSTFEAGDPANFVVQFLDAFNNNITVQSEPLMLYQTSEGPSNKKVYKVKRIEVKPGYEIATFLVTMSGNASLYVTDANNVAIFGSPFPFTVNPGPFALSNTTAEWQYGVHAFQVYSTVNLLIYPRDIYMNPLTIEDVNLQGLVYQNNSTNPLPVPDLIIAPHPTISWIRILSFTAGNVGTFKLYVGDASLQNIAKCPYIFEVFEGSIDGKATLLSGSGLSEATSGEETSFSVELRDNEGQPSGSYPGSVSVLFKKEGSEFPNSFKVMTSTLLQYEDKLAAASPPDPSKNVSVIAENSIGSFKVVYSIAPGNYELYVLWTNLILNDGKPFSLTVIPGKVDVSRCQCYRDKYNSKPRVKMWNNIFVLLNDSSGYQVYGKAESLSLSIKSIAGGYKIMSIIDNGNGSYTAAYMPLAVGVYKINVAYDNVTIPSCFMADYTHSDGFYPRANNDNARVIQGDVAIIDVLANDINGVGLRFLHNITEESD